MNTKERIDAVLAGYAMPLPGLSHKDFNPNYRLQGDLNLDSLDIANVIWELEDEFGIEIDDEEWDDMKIVGDIYECVKRKLGESE